jgi:hypothetical protein
MSQCQFPVFAIFVFQKSYTVNMLRIGRNKIQSSYFYRSVMESKEEMEGCQRAVAPPHGAGHPPGRAGAWCGALVHLLTPPFRLYIPLDGKT